MMFRCAASRLRSAMMFLLTEPDAAVPFRNYTWPFKKEENSSKMRFGCPDEGQVKFLNGAALRAALVMY